MELKTVNKYVKLVNRLMWIMDHSGISWKPEYEQEAEEIRKELRSIRPLIDEERFKKLYGERREQCAEEN